MGWFGLLFLSYTVMRRCRFARGDKLVCFTPKIWIINSYQCILCSRAFLYIHPQLSASPFLLILYLIFMPCRLHFCLCCHVTHHVFALLLLPVFVSSHCDCDCFRLCPLCVSLPPLYLSGLHFFADHYKSSLFVIHLPHTTHMCTQRVISSNKRLIYRQAWQVFSLLRSVWNQANIKEDRWVNHLCSPSRDHFKLEKLRIFIWKNAKDSVHSHPVLNRYLVPVSLHKEDIWTVKIDGECTNRIWEIMSDAQVCLISPAKINASQIVCTLIFYCICWL